MRRCGAKPASINGNDTSNTPSFRAEITYVRWLPQRAAPWIIAPFAVCTVIFLNLKGFLSAACHDNEHGYSSPSNTRLFLHIDLF
jgi:hypothetical protein